MTADHLFTDGFGIRHSLFHEPDGRTLRLIATQDTDAVTDRNKAMATHNDGYSPSRELRRVASVPAIVMMKWLKDEGWNPYRPDLFGEKIVQKLNDPDWMWLRTAPGRVGLSNGQMC